MASEASITAQRRRRVLAKHHYQAVTAHETQCREAGRDMSAGRARCSLPTASIATEWTRRDNVPAAARADGSALGCRGVGTPGPAPRTHSSMYADSPRAMTPSTNSAAATVGTGSLQDPARYDHSSCSRRSASGADFRVRGAPLPVLPRYRRSPGGSGDNGPASFSTSSNPTRLKARHANSTVLVCWPGRRCGACRGSGG